MICTTEAKGARCGHPAHVHNAQGRCLVTGCGCPQMSANVERSERSRRNQRHGERTEQAVRKLFESYGGAAYKMSDPGMKRGKSGTYRTGKTPGTPDVFVFFTAETIRRNGGMRDCPDGIGVAMWWEAKSGGGRLGATQREFQRLCKATNTLHGWGDEIAARAFLEHHGIIAKG